MSSPEIIDFNKSSLVIMSRAVSVSVSKNQNHLAITMVNYKKHKQHNALMRIQSKYM